MEEYQRTTCLPNTRLNVKKDIMEWIADGSDDAKKVLWVYGLAGTGKSTLSTTITQNTREVHRLGTVFFFNCDILQGNFATLIRTLAYQLAVFDARFGAAISRVAAMNENITEMPLDFQFSNLLSANALKSVEWSGGTIILIIDALDESGSEADRKILMRALSKGLSDLPSFIRMMVVSRQEPDIHHALGSHPDVRPYSLDIESATNKEDVSAFVRFRLDEIPTENQDLHDLWPGEDNIRALVKNADGLFVWASTACLYIQNYDPNQRLNELIMQLPEINESEPFTNLDKLYNTGLQSAGLWNN